MVDSIFVSDGTISVAGSCNLGAGYAACTWTGAARVDLEAPPSGAEAVFVHDDTVYAAGYYGDGIACLWTGTVRTELPGDGTNEVYAFGIWVE
jgi:hypothetical protein